MTYKWQKICGSEEELNNMFQLSRIQTMVVFGKRICLVKGSDGVYAVQERCPHNGASLGGGFCNEKDEIVCPLHRYPFSLKTGKATAGMASTLR